MDKIRKFYRWLFKIEEYVGMLLLVSMVLTVILQVLFRYVIGKPLQWTEELSRFLFVWLIMLEIGHCIPTGSHARVEVFVDMMPEKAKKCLCLVMRVLTLLLFIYLIPHAWQMTVAQHKVLSTALQIPFSFVYGSVLLGAILVVLHLVESFLLDIFPEKEGNKI